MPCLFWTIVRTNCAVITVSVFCLMTIARADERTQNESTRLLILRNGRIVSGNIERGPTGYLITKRSGRLVIPFKEVKLVAHDLSDAYQKQRNAMRSPDPMSHLELAHWCLNHSLYDATKEQLNGALKLNPGYEPAKRMLKRLDDILQTDRRVLETRPQQPETAETDGTTSSLSGLSQQSVRDFARVVQPLLMNRCANASCHGPHASNSFRLARVRSGQRSRRGLFRRNLAMTLAFVDSEHSRKSRLLTVFTERSRHRHELVFPGRSGNQQFESLRKWVLGVAQELEQKRNKKIAIAGRQDANNRGDADTNRSPGRFSNSQKTRPADASRQSNRFTKDAFDPEVFNAQRK